MLDPAKRSTFSRRSFKSRLASDGTNFLFLPSISNSFEGGGGGGGGGGEGGGGGDGGTNVDHVVLQGRKVGGEFPSKTPPNQQIACQVR